MNIKRLSFAQAVNDLVRFGRYSQAACVALVEHIDPDDIDDDFNPNVWRSAWREFDSFVSAYHNTAWVYGCGNHSGALDIDEETAKEWFNVQTAIIEFDGGVLVNMNF